MTSILQQTAAFFDCPTVSTDVDVSTDEKLNSRNAKDKLKISFDLNMISPSLSKIRKIATPSKYGPVQSYEKRTLLLLRFTRRTSNDCLKCTELPEREQ